MNLYYKIDNWLWRHFDRPIMMALRWASYVLIIVGIIKLDPLWLLAAAIIWLAWATVNQTGTTQQYMAFVKELHQGGEKNANSHTSRKTKKEN